MGKKKFGAAFLLLLLIQVVLFAGMPKAAQAATHKNEWVKSKGYMFYYNEDGKKETGGIVEIGSKKYFFTKSGYQRTGWRQVGDDYYFFKVSDGKNGYMLKDTTVNGIRLYKSGKAKMTDYARKKMPVLIKANRIRQSKTNANMTKSQKLKAVWKYLLKFQYRGSPKFAYNKNFDITYASQMFRERHGSCYHYGAAFAYLANACGYSKCLAVSSGGHGWAEVDGYIYDPSWQLVDGKRYSYFHMSPSMSGKNGIPGYRFARKYVNKI